MSTKEKSKVDDFLKDESYLKLPKVDEVYKEFIGKTKIEEYKEEDFVVKSLFQGKKKKWIMAQLNKKYPDVVFSGEDFEKFIHRNSKLVKAMESSNNSLARRHLSARTDCEEQLANLTLFTRELVKEYHDIGDSQATVSAIKALNQTLMNYCKLAGFLDEEKQPIKVENVIEVVSKKHDHKRDKIHSADFKMVEEE